MPPLGNVSPLIEQGVSSSTFGQPDTMANTDQGTRYDEMRYGFRVGHIGLLIDPEVKSEFVSRIPIAAMPNVATFLLGLMNVRGHLVPVFDLNQLLELGTSDQKGALVLIVDKGDRAVGLVVNQAPSTVQGLRLLPDPPQLPPRLSEHTHRVFSKDEVAWVEFDHFTFFQSLKKEVVAAA